MVDLLEPVARLVAEGAVFDAHVDSLQNAADLGQDLGAAGPGHLDLVRGKAGGLGAVVFVSWVDPSFIDAPAGGAGGSAGRGGAFLRTQHILAAFHGLLERHPQRLAWAGNGSLLERARCDGRVAGIPGIEGGHSIEESLEKLEWFFARGVRVMTLVWNNHLSWIRSCQDGAGAGVPAGLSEFGCDVVRRMNRLGMLVDLSHAGQRSFYDALDVSDAAPIASHSGCSALNDHPRNLDDAQLRALGQKGGVVGIAFCTGFLDQDARADEARLRDSAEYKAIDSENETQRFLDQSVFLQARTKPLALARVIDHIVHAVEVAGVDHVGLGSDYDGIQCTPAGLEDASCYPNLIAGLLQHGMNEEHVEKILGGNMRRAFALATGATTRAAQAQLTPCPAP
ncbi:MAG: membrane dipeptidase [Chlamydiales bacterium]|jgi:membrane dipeptidase